MHRGGLQTRPPPHLFINAPPLNLTHAHPNLLELLVKLFSQVSPHLLGVAPNRKKPRKKATWTRSSEENENNNKKCPQKRYTALFGTEQRTRRVSSARLPHSRARHCYNARVFYITIRHKMIMVIFAIKLRKPVILPSFSHYLKKKSTKHLKA